MTSLSKFASCVETETAFDVLAIAKQLKAAGKQVIELEIGDSPFATPKAALEAGLQAIRDDHTHYGPSIGIPEFREAAADYVNAEYGLNVSAENVVAAPGAKPFEQLFCEAFLDPGDQVLVFSPHFPTYPPNIARRGAELCLAPLREERDFRPDPADVDRFLDGPRPKAIFLNSPHNPTGGLAELEDLRAIADLIRGRDVALFSDEPYDQMVWRDRHHSALEVEGMLDQTLAAYTFSKSFSMSGWRLGFGVSNKETIDVLAKLANTAYSCVPPFAQLAGAAALRSDLTERDQRMEEFRAKVELLVEHLNRVPGVSCLKPGGTFYVFPNVSQVCEELGVTSHGLAMFLLEGADEQLGVACLGGECFGEAGRGFLRLSCAEPNDKLVQAVEFIGNVRERRPQLEQYLEKHPEYRAG